MVYPKNTIERGAKVETTKEYIRNVKGEYFKGVVMEKENNGVCRIESDCGCSKYLNVTWLKRIGSDCEH